MKMESVNSREPAVSGMFYFGDPEILKKNILSMIHNANPPKIKGQLSGLVAPHAGYMYSGQTAAYAYKLLKDSDFEIAVVMGTPHSAYINKASVYPNGFYKTPLGNIPVNYKIAEEIMKHNSIFTFNPSAHIQEHSIEVQLPFLQVVLNKFSILPVIIGFNELDTFKEIAQVIYNSVKESEKKAIFIASSDLSHYHSASVAKRMDGIVINEIQNMDTKKLYTLISEGKGEACGIGPILTLINIMKLDNATNCKILHQTDSGKITGDNQRVVGYVSASFQRS